MKEGQIWDALQNDTINERTSWDNVRQQLDICFKFKRRGLQINEPK